MLTRYLRGKGSRGERAEGVVFWGLWVIGSKGESVKSALAKVGLAVFGMGSGCFVGRARTRGEGGERSSGSGVLGPT